MSTVFEQKVIRLPKPNYSYIKSSEKAKEILNTLSNYKVLEIDTETTGLDPYTSKVSLLQIGTSNKAYIFDMRSDTEFSDISWDLFKPILTSANILKLLQNAVFDMKMIKVHGGYYIKNIYDTMLVEQLFQLGLNMRGADLESLVYKYLRITIDKEPRNTFSDYYQKFEPFQLEYVANDVLVLNMIRNLQIPKIIEDELKDVCRLEFEFTKPMCEMELNGICFDINKHRNILCEIEAEKEKYKKIVESKLNFTKNQITLFDISLINIDSNAQLLEALNKYGLSIPNTDIKTLSKYKGLPIIDELLNYRRAQKFISTYGENLIAKIHSITNRLHTEFRQMVSTGRMSSSNPNLQNIPKKQIYRGCFVSKFDYNLITADMSSCEVRILANLSADPLFLHCYKNNIDIHTKTASEIFGIPMGKVKKTNRDAAKALNFGIFYGLTNIGLAIRLGINEDKAQEIINAYFKKYKGVKRYLDKSAKEAVIKRFSKSISGRRRYYPFPELGHPDFNRIKMGVERQAKNMGIQGSNADVLKQGMIYLVDRLEKFRSDAKLLLVVHDEAVVECHKSDRYEVAKIVEQSIIDGFADYFDLVPMETQALIGPCWLKNSCGNKISDKDCNGTEFIFDSDSKLQCVKCGNKI